jgi:hypothetical protein
LHAAEQNVTRDFVAVIGHELCQNFIRGPDAFDNVRFVVSAKGGAHQRANAAPVGGRGRANDHQTPILSASA